jgi:Helix-turn-helix domain
VSDIDVLTAAEAAKLLRVKPGWVTEKCRSRDHDQIPHFRIGRYVRFEKRTLLEWFLSRGNNTAKRLTKGGRQ